jgi:hypothetical protein
MQIRSSNSAVATRTVKHNPMIIACDRNWDEVYRAPLDQIKGMAYGPRQDYESGYRGIKYNQCISDASRGADGRSIYGWTVVA